MSTQNTLYIAEPIFSDKLQGFDSDATFPPIKKIGITTDHPERRERELLGTKSPVKASIVEAWTGIDAKKVESMLHTMLDNTRLDGEYFWDGNETLVEAVTEFMESYHPEAKRVAVRNDSDTVAATEAAQKKNSQRVYTEVVPKLEALSIKHNVIKEGKGVSFKLGDYHRLALVGKTSGRYTLTIWSKTKSTEQALKDFPGSQAAGRANQGDRVARIPMSKLETIMDSIAQFIDGVKK